MDVVLAGRPRHPKLAGPVKRGMCRGSQRADLSLDARHGSELLMFLGKSLAVMIRKWLTLPEQS